MKEKEGARSEEPNYILTRLGLIASGGSLNVKSNLHHNFKINKVGEIHECSCEQLRQEVSFLKNCLRNYEVENKSIQPSKNDEIKRLFAEPNIKVVVNSYEILVPMKKDMIKVLPNNFNYAFERSVLLRRQALKNLKIKCTLIKTFDEPISASWLAPVDGAFIKSSRLYLAFFVTK